MGKSLKRLLVLALVMLSAVISTFAYANGEVYADNGAVILPGPSLGPPQSGGACDRAANQYRIDCAGASWVFYKAVNPSESTARDITFPYIDGNARFTIPAECAKHEEGGFWHYGANLKGAGIGINSRGQRDIWSNMGVYGHWSTRPFPNNGFTGNYSTVNSLNQDIEGVYIAYDGTLRRVTTEGTRDESMVGTKANVLRDYIVAWNYLHPDDPINSTGEAESKLTGIAVFCFWGGMNNLYKSKSNVSAMDIDAGDATKKYATTDVVEEGEAEAEIEVEVNKPTQIVFSHNAYSENGEGEPRWNLYRHYYKVDGDGAGDYTPFNNTRAEWFEIESADGTINGTFDAGTLSDRNKDGTITSWTLEGGYNVGNERTYTDGSDNYAVRDAMNVTFKSEGEWKFCETFKVADEIDTAGKQQAKTTACVTVKVGDPSREYYSVSNVSNDQALGAFETTGIVDHVERVTSIAEVETNTEVTITFSHNIYADREVTDNVPWEVTRNWSGSEMGYTITPEIEVTKTGSNPMPLEELGYYTVENSARHNDGYGTYYIVRERFKVIFTEEMTKEFCETVHIDGEEYTTSCAKIIAGDPPDDPVPDTCGNWTPDSYTESGILQGNTIKGTTSLVSKIRNPRLTSAAYGDWKGEIAPESGLSTAVGKTYAKPGDTVNWVNCYYPGAQALIDKIVVQGNVDPHPQAFNTLPTREFRYETTWQNDYKVTSSSSPNNVNGIFKVGSTIIGMPYEVEPPDGASISTTGNGSNPFVLSVELLPGDKTARQSSNDYRIQFRDDAGRSYRETMSSTGTPYYTEVAYSYHSWNGYPCGTARNPRTCPYYHLNRFVNGNNYARWTANNGTLTSPSEVIIPYNFINEASFDISGDDDDEVYAGDKIQLIEAQVTVNERDNAVTEASYITQVDEAEVRLIAYVSSQPASAQTGEQHPRDDNAASTNICEQDWLDKKQCMEVNQYNGGTTTLYNRENNTNPVTYGDTTGSTYSLGFNNIYNVYDASAGDYMCFVMAVYPWRSGIPQGESGYSEAEDQTVDPAGTEHKWLITAPKCRIIAKKPQLQVLGSSIYTQGSITASVSRKYNLYHLTEYSPGVSTLPGIGALGNPAIYFGSFDEQAIVANGLVTRFASGAAIGRTTENDSGYGTKFSDVDGFCDHWSPLTFANYATTSATTICGQGYEAAGMANITDASIVDREALVDYFIPTSATAEAAGSYSLGGNIGVVINSGTDKDIQYVKASGDATITDSTLVAGQTRVVKTEGNMKITGDVQYTGTYTKMAEVPKAILYATGDIEIDCGVARIDAILIAGGTVYTCNDYTVAGSGDDMENAERSEAQLVINGLIIASKVELARTYGNAVGIESGTAAEVVNYDTSVLLWGRSAAGANDSNAMSTVYMHELAPRY